jgi:hypothetical protein
MMYTSLDQIVRRSLLERNKPIHFYVEYLLHAAACLRELTLDSLRIVNVKEIPFNSHGAIQLPDDFVKEVSLSLRTGTYLKGIPYRDDINPLLRIAEDGEYERPHRPHYENAYPFLGYSGQWAWLWNVNDYGEGLGRMFGISGGDNRGYKVIPERNEIQVVAPCADSAVLTYISDGQNADSATRVPVEAFAAIQSYCDWKLSPYRAIINSQEANTWINNRRLLRARLSTLTTEDIINIFYQNYYASVKS